MYLKERGLRMKCNLCEKEIDNYTKQFHQFAVDDKHTYDICGDCIDKFIKWQGEKYSVLFPTRAMKKRFKK